MPLHWSNYQRAVPRTRARCQLNHGQTWSRVRRACRCVGSRNSGGTPATTPAGASPRCRELWSAPLPSGADSRGASDPQGRNSTTTSLTPHPESSTVVGPRRWSIFRDARLSLKTSVTIRPTPEGRPRISTSSNTVATPRPCHSSLTVTARSAASGTSAYRTMRANATGVLVDTRPECNYLWFSGIDVADAEVEVELLGVCASGPRWLDPVVDSLERERCASVRVSPVCCHRLVGGGWRSRGSSRPQLASR